MALARRDTTLLPFSIIPAIPHGVGRWLPDTGVKRLICPSHWLYLLPFMTSIQAKSPLSPAAFIPLSSLRAAPSMAASNVAASAMLIHLVLVHTAGRCMVRATNVAIPAVAILIAPPVKVLVTLCAIFFRISRGE